MPVYTTTWCNIPGIKVLLLTKGKRKRENEYEKADRMEKLGAGGEPRGRFVRAGTAVYQGNLHRYIVVVQIGRHTLR